MDDTQALVERAEPLLASEELDYARQGVALLEAAEAAEAMAALLRGTRFSPQGALLLGPQIRRRAHRTHRRWLALALLRASGRLEGLQRLDLSFSDELTDLTPLEGLPGLEALILNGCAALEAEDLPSLPDLRRLELGGCAAIRSLSAPPALPSLEVLRAPALGGLESCEIDGGLPALGSLELTMSPRLVRARIAGLPALRSLSIKRCRGLRRLTLSDLPALERLDVSGCVGLEDVQIRGPRPAEIVAEGCGALSGRPAAPDA